MSSHLVQLVIGSGVWTRTRTLMPCTTLVPTPELKLPGIPPGSICFYSHSDIVWTWCVLWSAAPIHSHVLTHIQPHQSTLRLRLLCKLYGLAGHNGKSTGTWAGYYRMSFDFEPRLTLPNALTCWFPVSNTRTGTLHGRLIIRTTHSWLTLGLLGCHQNNIIVCIYVIGSFLKNRIIAYENYQRVH